MGLAISPLRKLISDGCECLAVPTDLDFLGLTGQCSNISFKYQYLLMQTTSRAVSIAAINSLSALDKLTVGCRRERHAMGLPFGPPAIIRLPEVDRRFILSQAQSASLYPIIAYGSSCEEL